jgi:hypothetical protein
MELLLMIASLLCSEADTQYKRDMCEYITHQCIERECDDYSSSMSDNEQYTVFKTCFEELKDISYEKSTTRVIGTFIAGHLAGKALDEAYDRVKKKAKKIKERNEKAKREERKRQEKARSQSEDVLTARFDP